MSHRTASVARKDRLTRQAAPWVVVMGLSIVSSQGVCRAGSSGVTEVVGQVRLRNYRNYLDNDLYAHDGNDRSCEGAQHDLARGKIRARFQSFGLVTSLDAPFPCCGRLNYNVVGVQPGLFRPEDIYIIGGHYDTVPGSPGAWDNASGVAGVLEAARVLSRCRFEATLVFIAFDREEEGRKGSDAYAEEHRQDHIRGVICLDGIAYRPYQPQDPSYRQVGLYWQISRTTLIDEVAAALRSYAGLNGVIARDDLTDDAPFARRGFPTAALISRGLKADVPPPFHQPSDSVDTPGYLDYEYGVQVTRGAVGYLAAQAKLVPARVPADFNSDGLVNFRDYALWAQRWRQSALTYDLAPAPQGDGVVNLKDLATFSHHWLNRWSNVPPALAAN